MIANTARSLEEKSVRPNVLEKKYNWNKKSKYWRPEWIADKWGLNTCPKASSMRSLADARRRITTSTTADNAGVRPRKKEEHKEIGQWSNRAVK